jgi:hypothetical protein
MFIQCRILVAVLAITSRPHSPSLEAQSVASNLAALQSDDAHTRITGLNRLDDLSRKQGFPLCSPQASSQVKRGLIAGLEKENRPRFDGRRGGGRILSESHRLRRQLAGSRGTAQPP